ncbi:hypothetical protein [Salininema proteolyticum]|uniref:Uncharacterized protein n=1 Tax=Salininema proteolyticum TaxID=1607685 RepID=A0ABV8TXV2_9ACTN
MRRVLTLAALWAVVAAFAVGGGSAIVLWLLNRDRPDIYKSPDQVKTELDALADGEKLGESEKQIKNDGAVRLTTDGGVVWVLCDGNAVDTFVPSPALGWFVSSTGVVTGGSGPGEQKYAEFWTDDQEEFDRLEFQCSDGEATEYYGIGTPND